MHENNSNCKKKTNNRTEIERLTHSLIILFTYFSTYEFTRCAYGSYTVDFKHEMFSDIKFIITSCMQLIALL